MVELHQGGSATNRATLSSFSMEAALNMPAALCKRSCNTMKFVVCMHNETQRELLSLHLKVRAAKPTILASHPVAAGWPIIGLVTQSVIR